MEPSSSLQKTSSVFTAAEVADQHASREMAYKIQKWNVQAAGTFPILLANTWVDWLGIEDQEITQHFPILREGILSGMAGCSSSESHGFNIAAWACPPDKWLDYLQSQRHFWPSMTTRFASLVPLNGTALRRERQRLKSKHLWDTIRLDWNALYDKLYVLRPTGLVRTQLWELFWNKHRVVATIQGFTVENDVAKKAVALVNDRHARRWHTKEGTYRILKQL